MKQEELRKKERRIAHTDKGAKARVNNVRPEGG